MVKNILVVDDDQGVTHTVKYGLEGLSDLYNVISVESGEKCLEFLKNNKIPDLIVLDIMMPGITGWETHDRIKENLSWKNIPIIFLTARKDSTAKNVGGFLGDEFIEKPCKITELKEKIDNILKI